MRNKIVDKAKLQNAKILISTGKYKKALTVLTQLLDENGFDNKLFVAKLNILQLLNEHQKIIDICKKARSDALTDVVRCHLARAFIKLQKFERAQTEIEGITDLSEKKNLTVSLSLHTGDYDTLYQTYKSVPIKSLTLWELSNYYKACSCLALFQKQPEIKSRIMTLLQEEISEPVEPFDLLSITDLPDLILKNNSKYDSKISRILDRPVKIKRKKQKISIGYFSPDFGAHPITHLITGLIRNHDRNKFHVIGFSLKENKQCKYANRIKREFDQVYEISSLEDVKVLDLCDALSIDIAIDLAGFTAHHRSSLFASRVSDVQINFLGTPSTLGTNYHDYIVTDSHITAEKDLLWMTEKPIFVNPCFQPNDERRYKPSKKLSKNYFGLPVEKFVLGCFSSLSKLNNEILNCWIEILKQNPDSIFFLYEPEVKAQNNFLNYVSKSGIQEGRIIFSGKMQYETHLERYSICDLILDTYPFGGGATASDCIWSGVPMVVFYGRSFSSRMSSSLLRSVSLGELVAESFDDYVRISSRFIRDLSFRQRVEQKLKGVQDHEVFNSSAYAKKFESELSALVGQ